MGYRQIGTVRAVDVTPGMIIRYTNTQGKETFGTVESTRTFTPDDPDTSCVQIVFTNGRWTGTTLDAKLAQLGPEHTITIELVTPELRRQFCVPSRQTIVIMERFDGDAVKVCHVMDRRSPRWQASAMAIAGQFARSYGAVFVVPDATASKTLCGTR